MSLTRACSHIVFSLSPSLFSEAPASDRSTFLLFRKTLIPPQVLSFVDDEESLAGDKQVCSSCNTIYDSGVSTVLSANHRHEDEMIAHSKALLNGKEINDVGDIISLKIFKFFCGFFYFSVKFQKRFKSKNNLKRTLLTSAR